MAKPRQLRGARAHEAILAAAGALFLADGLRGTSVEAIASAAGVSRPTVYAHFASKEEIFRTIVTDLHDDHLAAMQAAVDPAATFADRLHALLAARFVPFVELTAASPHGAELLDESSRVCGDIIRAARTRSLELLEAVLADAQSAGEIDLGAAEVTPSTAAAVILDAASGAKQDAGVTALAYRRQLRRLVTVLARGLAAS